MNNQTNNNSVVGAAQKADNWMVQPWGMGISHCTWIIIGLLGVIVVMLIIWIVSAYNAKKRQNYYYY